MCVRVRAKKIFFCYVRMCVLAQRSTITALDYNDTLKFSMIFLAPIQIVEIDFDQFSRLIVEFYINYREQSQPLS